MSKSTDTAPVADSSMCGTERHESITAPTSPSNTPTSPLTRSRDQLLKSGFYLADDNVINNHELAELSTIVVIDSKNYWLTSDAGYQRAPPTNPHKSDFIMVMKNLRILMQKIATPGFEKGKGFLFHDNGSPTPMHFKIRHCLFERLTEDNAHEDVLDLSQLHNGTDFLPENMKLTHEQTRKELFLLQRTHRLQPLQVQGQDGKILSPATYQESLKNAIVELHFNLWHWPIGPRNGSTGNDSYTAEIVHIHILEAPPPAVSNSPRKRKIPAYVDPEESVSASKKREM
ncbi:hypothetical protein PISMIDRAFT_19098 [Pisolithus microcarpus 441]|uniref:Unplaced genomic scaffold scaffold_451, whole genome shotgun sequence n=1 Tax=Pisolithus microcarpus 441 TaxID=765257 RepID=A0A0C9Y4H1_9AGAM|nr:hypothetical protein BKA83DRAFT_19098 [Pisolithus microcarpus]KIK11951.1 hypothetical protein PISMIDRAFT_19098 [Pisolithus microcarpus 441]